MKTLARWDPWREFETLQERINRIFDTSLLRRYMGEEEGLETGSWVPAIDVIDNRDHYLVRADLPGVSKDDIEVDVSDGTLTIKGEKKRETKEEGDNYIRVERTYGTFVRSFTLPDDVDSDKIKASYENGVLELVIPKKEEAKPKKIKVEVK